uniref:Uncharacterized protein n=1 Tax=Meloidogyne enterolobii TaxID=390850 RepID=A0A6V7W577_MELEN|nr:unnamed protein product [Meloidogyne enterolobii]
MPGAKVFLRLLSIFLNFAFFDILWVFKLSAILWIRYFMWTR